MFHKRGVVFIFFRKSENGTKRSGGRYPDNKDNGFVEYRFVSGLFYPVFHTYDSRR